MSDFNRVRLQRAYVERILDGMDLSDLMMIASDCFHEKLEAFTDEEFVEEVKDFYPDLLEEGENE